MKTEALTASEMFKTSAQSNDSLHQLQLLLDKMFNREFRRWAVCSWKLIRNNFLDLSAVTSLHVRTEQQVILTAEDLYDSFIHCQVQFATHVTTFPLASKNVPPAGSLVHPLHICFDADTPSDAELRKRGQNFLHVWECRGLGGNGWALMCSSITCWANMP